MFSYLVWVVVLCIYLNLVNPVKSQEEDEFPDVEDESVTEQIQDAVEEEVQELTTIEEQGTENPPDQPLNPLDQIQIPPQPQQAIQPPPTLPPPPPQVQPPPLIPAQPVPQNEPQEPVIVQPPETIPEVSVPAPKSRRFTLFKKDELTEKHKEETKELLDKQNKERKETYDKQKKERQEIRVRQEKEKQESKEKLKQEQEELNKKKAIEKSIEENTKQKTYEEAQKNKNMAQEKDYERKKEVRKAKFSKRTVDIVTNESDPLYITEAEVLNSKTPFLKIKDVEFKYRARLHNQTPKIINSVLLVWERGIPFNESLTLAKETKISKPIIPYGKRTVEYNDLDSKREGEIYRLRITKVIFEDGTQWINPVGFRRNN